MARIERAYEVKAKPGSMFAFLDDVKLWGQHMMGMWKNFRHEIQSDKPTGLGAIHHWRGSAYGWKFEWTEVVTKWTRNVDKEQHSVKGMKMDSGWSLTPHDGGMTVRVWMDYELGSSWFAKLVDILYAKRFCSNGLDRDFAHLKKLLEEQSKVEGAQTAKVVN